MKKLVLCLLACLVAAACTPHDGGADQDSRHGFYGGVSAGR